MGYLLLAVSILSGSIKGFFAKKVSNATSGLGDAILSNLIRMLLCIPIGLLFVLIDGGASTLVISGRVLCISALAGITTSLFIVSWLLAVKTSALTSTDAFISLGILVPIILSSIIYREIISLSQIIGLCLLFLAVYVMCVYNNQVKDRLSIRSFLLLLTVGLANGLTDFSYKMFEYAKSGVSASIFNFYIYVFSTLTLLVLFIILRAYSAKRAVREQRQGLDKQRAVPLHDKRKVIYIAIMAIFLFSHTYFKTLAASRLSAVLMYPLAQGASMVFAVLMSAVFFKEKIKPLCIIGMSLLFVALLFINVFVF